MKTASRNPERWLRLAALSSLVLAMLACGTSSNVEPTQSGQPGQAPTSAPVTGDTATPPASSGDACFKGIIPGQTSRETAISLLGEPATVYSEGTKENLGYPSFIAGMDDFLVVENNTIVLASRLVDPSTLSLTQLKELMGEPEKETYSYFMMGTRTYLYPGQGLAFVVEPEGDLVLFQECTVIMTLDEYMQTWGAELPLEDPYQE